MGRTCYGMVCYVERVCQVPGYTADQSYRVHHMRPAGGVRQPSRGRGGGCECGGGGGCEWIEEY